ncbi:hypothetical protein B0T11DRAFT_358770 [Plectosphaerella cucumerina]|uniref:Uncharacterized protein n=1 Tax=Plectosphaerella cucumerina TaxID=40658 RepID=A0A8K0X018_9PEZI|nr:hypothetical protein B0T11DRAFT_358770 [Plectosphaerella cucumerina]
MQFNYLFPLALLATFVSHANAQVAAIEAAFLVIAGELDDFGAAFATGTSSTDILNTGADLVTAIDAATPIVQGSPNIGFFQAIDLAESLGSVGDSAEAAFDTVVAQRAAADTLGITPQVRVLIEDVRDSIAALGAALVPKVPFLLRSQVQEAVADVDARLADAIAVYS